MSKKSNAKIIETLKTAYAMELETVQNYIAASVNLDGCARKSSRKSSPPTSPRN